MSSPAPILTVVDAARPDDDLSDNELGSRIVGLAGRLAAATCRWLLLIAEFDRREGCARFGVPSTARWLAHHCGIAHRTAVEHVRVARSLAGFPALATEMGAGRLSYSQVRAISRVPKEGEQQVVDDLIQVAEHGTAAQLETVVRGLRTVEDNEIHGDRTPEQYIRHSWTSASQWRVSARLAPEQGALVQAAIDRIAQAEGLPQVDALVRMAEIALAAVNDSEHPPRPLRGDERAALVLHVDAAALTPAETAAQRPVPPGRLADGPGLPRAVIERLLCSGRIRTAIHDREGNVRDLGRSHRTVSERQFRALLIRDVHCRHPGCTSRSGLQAHHVRHWIHGGRTDLANLVLLCERHHHALHDGEVEIVSAGPKDVRFVRSDGRALHEHPRPDALSDSPAPIEAGVDVAADAARPRWGGERLDRPWAVAVLAGRRHGAMSDAS